MRDTVIQLRDTIHAASWIDSSIYQKANAPVVSIYMPVEHKSRAERRDDWTGIQYKDLIKKAEDALAQSYTDAKAYEGIIERMKYLYDHADDPIWLNAKEGLGFLFNNDSATVYNLDFAPVTKVVVGATYDIDPLLKNLEMFKDYYLLLLHTDSFELLRGDSVHLNVVKLPPEVKTQFTELYPEQEPDAKSTDIGPLDYYSLEGHMSPFHNHKSRNDVTKEHAEKFFRYVNKVMTKIVVHNDPTSIILVALPEEQAMFRKLSTLKTLCAKGIEKDPNGLTGDQLREDAIKIMNELQK